MKPHLKIVQFRGTKLYEPEAVLLHRFEEILGCEFRLVAKITWDYYEVNELLSKAKYFLNSDKKEEVDFLSELMIRNRNVVGIALFAIYNAEILNIISEFNSLQYLVLCGGNLETIPENLGNLKNLKVLSLGNNKIEYIPDSIGDLESLQFLWLNNNHIKVLPESIGNLQSLLELHLDFNYLKKLPESIKYLTSLKTLNLRGIRLKWVPEWIGVLSSLERLLLGENDLSFIPDSLENLCLLKELDLRKNNLRHVPAGIIKLNTLKNVYLDDNENFRIIPEILNILKFKGVSVVTSTNEAVLDLDLKIRIKINGIFETGRNFITNEKYDKALKVLTKTRNLIERLTINYDKLQYKSVFHSLLSRIYFLQGYYKKSLKTGCDGLDFLKNLGDLAGKANTLNNIGNIYNIQGEFKKALSFYEKGLNILINLGLENTLDALTISSNIKNIKKRIPEKVFVVNKFITLHLENNQTNIYIKDELFRQCKFLFLDIPVKEFTLVEEIRSIDEAAEKLNNSLEGKTQIEGVLPESEFWGHCSNLQAWYENDYDTRLLHRNLAFPLLKKLTEAGDPLARKFFKEEIAKRYNSGFPSVVEYLEEEGYLKYLSKEEKEALK